LGGRALPTKNEQGQGPDRHATGPEAGGLSGPSGKNHRGNEIRPVMSCSFRLGMMLKTKRGYER
jgi:hypothetical protein